MLIDSRLSQFQYNLDVQTFKNRKIPRPVTPFYDRNAVAANGDA